MALVDFQKYDKIVLEGFFHFFEFWPIFENIHKKRWNFKFHTWLRQITGHILDFRSRFGKMRKPLLEKMDLYRIKPEAYPYVA